MSSSKRVGHVNVPGKILLLGGYTVLEPGNPALSLAVLDSRGRGVTASVERSASDMLVSEEFGIKKEIRSPEVVRENVAASAFYTAKTYLESKGLTGHWEVRVHNSPMFGRRFKSGLGSSAASTVAVVKSLFRASRLDLRSNGETMHKLSQYAYAAYAGKAESGFDIATCAYGGSIVYTRYLPGSIELPGSLVATEFLERLLQSLTGTWRGLRVKSARVPAKFSVLFFNIEGARTSTTGNVGAVMGWRATHARKYTSLIEAQKLHELAGIESFQRGEGEELRARVRMAREIQRKLQVLVAAERADFDLIEPPVLTKLIEFGESLPGVVVGRCPGAGGWDGLVFVTDEGELKEGTPSKIVTAAKGRGLTLTRVRLRLA